MTTITSKTKLNLIASTLSLLFVCNINPIQANLFKSNRSIDLFNRVAVFPVFNNTDINAETVAEIVAASENGNTLIYTDSETENAGFVDISNPANPQPLGATALPGEPTSVAVANDYALVVVNTSADFVNTSGQLVIVDIATRSIVHTIPFNGQPDSITVSPDQQYAAIVIENERDEDLGDGEPPQAPGGFLIIVDLIGAPSEWTTRSVILDGLAELVADGPEPEYVDINKDNIAIVTLQENNHLILVNLVDGSIENHFSAGTVDLRNIDTEEEKPSLITQNSSLFDVPREPDGVTWLSERFFMTADEGDLNGGSRGITLFDKDGKVKYTSGNALDELAIRLGHYPDKRSGNKGNEPENVEFGRYGNDDLLFAGSERSSLIFVYKVNGQSLNYLQTLPAGVGPEGLLAIPQRNLFIAASEVDDRGDKIRSVLNIYQRQGRHADYPTIVADNKAGGLPIAWGALSDLAMDKKSDKVAYTIHDSFYQQTRIYKLNTKRVPAKIKRAIVLHDNLGLLAAVEPFLVNLDNTVNLDGEGISTREDGGFWIASEGDDAPVKFANLLLKVNSKGDIEKVVTLPDSVQERMIRFGFEGVVSVGSGTDEVLYVAFQREWNNDKSGHVRIGRYHVANDEWLFYYYPLEAPLSPNGGWVGLSAISVLGDDEFAVIERDNQAGPDAVIKRIYSFSLSGLTPLPDPAASQEPDFPVISKTLLRDLIPDLKATGGLVLEKIEGLMFNEYGDAFIVNDNDGVDDSSGETQLLKLNLDN